MGPTLIGTWVWLAAILAHPGRPGNVVWLECERFDTCGGWTVDSQFIDQMGSPYLVAAGLGQPVDDAVTRAGLPAPGRYRLWARTRDWVPEHHPGRFRILLEGRAVGRVFGAAGRPGWIWEDGGVHELSRSVEIRLGDLTGYYARCDVVLLTDDLSWVPPVERDTVDDLRQRYRGVSPEIADGGQYDVVVVGGGLAGSMAAVSAARSGARTALLQNRAVLGGNASVEILVPPVGVWPHAKMDPLNPRETGLIEEVRTAGNQRTEEAKVYSGRLLRLVRAEPQLDLHLNTHATGVQKKTADTIGAVLAAHVRTAERIRFGGRIFIDCTGDGSVGVAAGAEYRHGTEPRSMYDEWLAPEKGNGHTMGSSLKYVSQPTGRERVFTAQPWMIQFPRCSDFPARRHPPLSRNIEWQWVIELGGTRNTFDDAEEIRDDLLRLIYGMWDHTKNHCEENRDKAADHRLAWVGHVLGKRETRRLVGDYVLHQNDIAQQTLFPDRVAYGGWGVDDHHPEGFFYDRWPPSSHPTHMFAKGKEFSIPFRSLYSRNIDNLLMAGRDISASHVALAATRVMLTCAVIGQAAGTAAAMCVEHDATPRELYRRHIAQLQQQLLKDGAYLIDLANDDPCDQARSATVTASSERTGPRGQPMAAVHVTGGHARSTHGQTNAWGPDANAPGPHWIQLAWDHPGWFNVVHVTFLTKDQGASHFAVQVWHGARWQTVAELTGNRHRRHTLGFERVKASKLRVVLRETGSRVPGICEIRVYDEPDRLVDVARRATQNRQAADQKPDLPWDDSVPWITGMDPKDLEGIVIDSSQADLRGNWVHSEFSQPFIVDGYLHDGDTQKGAKSMRFLLQVPNAGTYEVRIAYLAYPNRATNTPVTIQSGSETRTVRVNQRVVPAIGGLFHRLGTYHLAPDEPVRIEIGNAETDGYVVVDAIQLVPAEEPPR